jgi:uncharacterized protein (DUF2235 family)
MPKHLVVCCDGTWNTAYQSINGIPCPSNVTRLALSIADKDSDGQCQRVYYHPGVGTSRWDHLRGGAFGAGLSANVLDAYLFLIDNYEPGDDLYFFGFSRGAFTARSAAGMVRNCGILRAENRDRIDDAYRLYRSKNDKPSGMTSTLFRSAFSHEPTIEFIAVWDTVGALGIPPVGPGFLHPVLNWVNKRWSFHDTELSSHVHGAYHALAIDERRGAFKPTLWKKQPGAKQTVEQVWFAGVHCNVGGGLIDSSLSDLALLWVVNKAEHHGLAFKDHAFKLRQEGDTGELKPGEEAKFTVAPNPMTLPGRSYTLLYRLIGLPFDRPIGVETGDDGGYGQNVAETAVQLREKKPNEYHPKELIHYLARTDRPTPAEIPLSYTRFRSPALPKRQQTYSPLAPIRP